MSVSPEWDDWYANNHPIEGWYPHLNKLFDIFVVEAAKVLELGVGSGGNVRPALKRGYGYHGIEGSEKAVATLHAAYPDLKGRLVHGDFTEALPFGGEFDLIFDRASLPHNDMASMQRCIGLVYDALKPGGIFIASDWFSSWHSEFARGERLGFGTRTRYTDGQFRNIGVVQFLDLNCLADLFSAFDGIHVEERIILRPGPNRLVKMPINFRHISIEFADRDYRSAVWDLVVRKPL